MKKYYGILELSENATSEEIKKSYKGLSLKWHPDSFDRNPINHPAASKKEAEEKFKEIVDAYTFLSYLEESSNNNIPESEDEKKNWERELSRRRNERIREIDEELRKIAEARERRKKEGEEELKLKIKNLIQEIKSNLSDWKIEDEKVIDKNKNYEYISLIENNLEENDRSEWFSIKNQIKQSVENLNSPNSNYATENFEAWLNADKKRKRGLWLWGQVIDKVKSDPDLFNALATGIDQGGWNISDPKFRKQYQFEEYYQVFSEWKREIDNQNNDNTNNEEETENKSNPNYPPLLINNSAPEYKKTPFLPISSIGTNNNEKSDSQMPFGSALLTNTGTSSNLKEQGINYIIHAALLSLKKDRSNEEEFITTATLAIRNSLFLADRQGIKKLATCFLGGEIYCSSEEVRPKLAEALIRASLNQLEQCKRLKEVVFVDFSGDYYQLAWKKIKQENNCPKIIKKTKIKKGDLCQQSTHHAEAIINSENAQMEWGEGISKAIKLALGKEATAIGTERKNLMREFNSLISEKTINQQSKNNDGMLKKIITSPWTWLVVIISLISIFFLKKLKNYC